MLSLFWHVIVPDPSTLRCSCERTRWEGVSGWQVDPLRWVDLFWILMALWIFCPWIIIKSILAVCHDVHIYYLVFLQIWMWSNNPTHISYAYNTRFGSTISAVVASDCSLSHPLFYCVYQKCVKHACQQRPHKLEVKVRAREFTQIHSISFRGLRSDLGWLACWSIGWGRWGRGLVIPWSSTTFHGLIILEAPIGSWSDW